MSRNSANPSRVPDTDDFVKQEIVRFIEKQGLSGYKQCTLKTLTNAVNLIGGEYVVGESAVEETLREMEHARQIFRITHFGGDCFALRTKPDEVPVLDIRYPLPAN